MMNRPAPAAIRLLVLFLLFRPFAPLSAEPPRKPAGRPSVALVLAGGGAKGYAHIPVLELIDELGIPVDMVIGTSAGASVGGLYCAGYSPQTMKELLLDLDWNSIFQDRPVFPFEHELGSQSLEQNPLNFKFSRNFTLNTGRGFSNGQEVYKLFKSLTAKIPSYIHFDDLPVPFRATAVELATGKLRLFSEGDLAEAIRASMSLPAVFEPFNIDGKYYLDGGVLNNLPVDEAKALGYDIVIAVELMDEISGEEQNFDFSPLPVLNRILSIYLHTGREARYNLADAVLIPDIARFTILDFSQAREIYARAEQEKERFRGVLLDLREKIFGGPEAEAVTRRGEPYSDLPAITLGELKMSGVLRFDEKFIAAEFARLLRDRPLERKSLAAFLDAVYKTGNYIFATARIDTRGRAPLLELNLIPLERRNGHIIFGAAFHGTIAAGTSAQYKLALDTQLRGLFGPGSVLALGVTAPHVASFHGIFFQPVNQRLFFSAGFDLVQDQEMITSGFNWEGQTGSSMIHSEVRAGLGFKIGGPPPPGFNIFTAGAAYFSGSYFEGVTDYLTFTHAPDSPVRAQVLGVNAGWEYSTLDYPMFAGRGVYIKAGNSIYFPLKEAPYSASEAASISDVVSADFTAAVPLADKITLALNGFSGGDITGNLGRMPAHTVLLGYNTADRLYFPQISGRQRYGDIKNAALLLIQAEPFKNKLFGASLFFAAAAAAGFIVNDYDEVSYERLYWNSTFNIGLRFTSTFGAALRLGAGKGELPGITPVITLDLGSLRY
jgi:NTE family protein